MNEESKIRLYFDMQPIFKKHYHLP